MFAGAGALANPNLSWLDTSPVELDLHVPALDQPPAQTSALAMTKQLTGPEAALVQKMLQKDHGPLPACSSAAEELPRASKRLAKKKVVPGESSRKAVALKRPAGKSLAKKNCAGSKPKAKKRPAAAEGR